MFSRWWISNEFPENYLTFLDEIFLIKVFWNTKFYLYRMILDIFYHFWINNSYLYIIQYIIPDQSILLKRDKSTPFPKYFQCFAANSKKTQQVLYLVNFEPISWLTPKILEKFSKWKISKFNARKSWFIGNKSFCASKKSFS